VVSICNPRPTCTSEGAALRPSMDVKRSETPNFAHRAGEANNANYDPTRALNTGWIGFGDPLLHDHDIQKC